MKQFRLGYAEPCCNEAIDMNKTLLVTGVAGFIGGRLTQALLVRGDTVVGLDNLTTIMILHVNLLTWPRCRLA